ncbi:translation machinery-associated protein 16 [Coemansia sp. S100]|nr:translation machinery-associated protein 16 [Coemansia sp. S100]
MEQVLDPSIVPFPVLKSTKVLLPYPFAGDELFRGNSSTLKHLDFWIDENAVNVIYGGGALSKHRDLQVTISRVYYGIPNLPEGTMDLFLASLAGAARSLTLPASVVVKNIQVAVQGDYKFEHIQVFEATLDKLSLFSILCLLKALPALIELRCGISGLGSELEGVSANRLPDHIASTYGALGQNLRVWHIPSTNHDDDDNIIECIPNNKRKRVSKIKDKEKAHPYSRKARQINRAMHKETSIAKAKSERINAALGRGQKIVWFRDNMDKGEEEVEAKLKKKMWTMVELRQLVDVYLERNDEEIETILAKKEEGKNLLQKESLFLQLVDSEVKEAKLAGVEVPDLTNGAVVKTLRAWDGDLNSITTIKLVTCKPASIIPIEEEAKNSRRGDSASAKADKIPQLLTEQQAIEIATGMAVN